MAKPAPKEVTRKIGRLYRTVLATAVTEMVVPRKRLDYTTSEIGMSIKQIMSAGLLLLSAAMTDARAGQWYISGSGGRCIDPLKMPKVFWNPSNFEFFLKSIHAYQDTQTLRDFADEVGYVAVFGSTDVMRQLSDVTTDDKAISYYADLKTCQIIGAVLHGGDPSDY